MSAEISTIDDLADQILVAESTRIAVTASAVADMSRAVLAKAAQLQQAGEPLRVVCATTAGAAHLRAVAADLAGFDPDCITTAQDLALEFMADPRVQEATLRSNRVLDPNEMDVLIEDLKVTGEKQGRLKEMLKFFYHCLADTTAEGTDWFVSPEERVVFGMLEENLEIRHALLPYEVAAKAWQGLTASCIQPGLTIIADDFGCMSRSTHRLLEYVSGGRIIAFGSTAIMRTDDEPYPQPDDFEQFAQAADTLAIDFQPSAPAVAPCTVYDTPREEFLGIADQTAQLLEAGCAAGDILIAAPNTVWARKLRTALAAKGIDTFIDLGPKKITGDPRDPNRCGEIKLTAFLKYLADRSDYTAFRTFMGMGDYLLRSDGFLELMAQAREAESTVLDTLAAKRGLPADQWGTACVQKLVAPLTQLEQLIDVCQDGTAAQVAAAFEAAGMALGDRASLLGEPDAKADFGALAASCSTAADALPADRVIIAPLSRCHGHRSRVTIITGMVDGFLPNQEAVDDGYSIDRKRQAMERDRLLFESIKATASEEVRLSRFQRDVVDNTARLHMQISRIYHDGDRRIARIIPSSLLD